MKKTLVVITLLVLVLSLAGCAQSQTPPPPPDIPRYTADQIIAVAQAKYDAVRIGTRTDRTEPKVEVSYEGQGVWQVIIRPPLGYYLQTGPYPGGPLVGIVLYFYEDTGQLK